MEVIWVYHVNDLLIAEGITKSYRMGKIVLTVLKGINLRVSRGEIMVIAGPSGAGKSTLLHILGALDAPDAGRVILEESEIFRLGNRARARVRNEKIGFVFQFFHLLPEFSAWENVILPCRIKGGGETYSRKKLKALASRLLGRVGLEERLEHYPSQLSGGEQQRVAIARALANQPQLVLADEPTGNLDSRTSQDLLELFSSLNNETGQTFIVVSHDQQIADWAPRILHIRDGVLLE